MTWLPDRRTLLLGGGALALAASYIAAGRLAARPIALEPIAGAAPFQRVVRGGTVTAARGAADLLTLGIEPPGPVFPEDVRAAAATAAQAPVLPTLAMFTAAGCPLCPVQSDRLGALGAAPRYLPLALFGPASERAARAMIAVETLAPQAAVRLHDRLTGTPLLTEDPLIAAVAAEEGLDPDALLALMDAPATTAALALNHALAERLRLPGTPGTLVGRTLAVGLTSADTIRTLLEDGPAT